MSLRITKLQLKKENGFSAQNYRNHRNILKKASIDSRSSKLTTRKNKIKARFLKPYEKNLNALQVRLEGLAYREKIHKEIMNRNQMLDFWSGAWNKKLLIQPASLSHLSRFIEYRIKTTQVLLRKPNFQFEYNDDTLIAWLFYQWLMLSTNQKHHPIPQQLPTWFKHDFLHIMDLSKHVNVKLSAKLEIVNQPLEKLEKEVKSELNLLKSQISKALSEGILNACLEEESQKVIFGGSPSNTQIQELFTTTNLLIEFGNHLGMWDLCFINSVIIPFHETNPFADENEWKRALRFEKTVHAIESVHEKHVNDIDFLHARVITSLMIESYILDENLLKSVLQSLNSPHKLLRIGKQLVIWSAPQNKPNRLVFISELTELYYRQYLAACLKQKHKFELELRFPDSKFYRAIGHSKHTVKLSTFKSWKHSVKVYLQLKGYLDGMSLAYASGDIQSHALLPKVLNRFFSLGVDASESTIHAENLSNHGRLPRSFLWTQLRSILNVKHINKTEEYNVRQGIKGRIRNLIVTPQFSENEKLIARYALARIDKSHGFEAISPSTILGHIDAFGLPLILSAESFSLTEISPTQRQAIYFNAIEMKYVNPKRFLYFLKLFEDWLIKNYGKPKQTKSIERIPDYEELFSDIKRPEYSVDANIINFEEYEKTKSLLVEAYIASNGEKLELLQASILLILGFKLDLRRSEAIFLHSKDYIFDPEQANLFVKPHDKRALKTNNANRMYHLEEHLTSQEIGLFEEYLGEVGRRLQVEEATYLFPDKKTTLCPPDRILNPLLQVLRQVTGDSDFKFHNLRHSKASWDMLSIFNAQFNLRLEKTIFNHMPKTAQFLTDSKVRWSNAVHTEQSFHKAPFYLHRQMGHGSLVTTLKNYIHTMDFTIAGLQQLQAERVLSIEWASRLGIVKKSTLHNKLVNNEHTIQEYLLEKVLPWSTVNQSKDSQSNQEPESTEPLDSSESLPTLGSAMRSGTLLPLQELQKWKAFCLFEIFHLILDNKDEELRLALQRLNLEAENLPKILEYFRKNKQTRLKMPIHDASFHRLIDEFFKLPSAWQEALLNDSFNSSEHFESERTLITHTMSRISVKLQDTKFDLSPVKEIDIICSNTSEARPVIELIRILDWKIKCRFMNPQNGSFSWSDWKKDLLLEESEINEDCVVKATVKNTHGRLTIRLKRDGKSSAKYFEQYLLLALLAIKIDIT
ncbi:hypothetical protein [Thiomicrorhabdus lithotrophica]|uniref:Phage integrase family protein n=1 Tax=Thiomicrorhabdus lithotrophica TaxID=2949997 RepID=A0ABY8C9E3_9GAMM|nr:hypothetical protein [Thiomicrorhabdus lithotrophica]WEJ62539.1 hypothetical protein NR989_11055 [Thiomicrorhabdus lithotrophica]